MSRKWQTPSFSPHSSVPPGLPDSRPTPLPADPAAPEAQQNGTEDTRRPRGTGFTRSTTTRKRLLVGYLAAAGIPILTIALTTLIFETWPAVNLQGLLPILSIIAVAFFWGQGPGLLATLIGVCFLDYALFFLPGSTTFTPVALLLQTLRVAVTGTVISLIVSGTQRERLRVAIQARELDTILATLADGLFVYDKQGQIQRTNPTAKEFNSQVRHEQYLKQPFGTRFAPLSLQDAQGNPLTGEKIPAARVLRGEVLTGEKAVDLSFLVDGSPTRLFNTTGAPIRDEHGEIQGAVMVLRDVTERRRLEKENLLRVQQLNTLIETVPDAIIVVDQVGRITLMNASAHQLLPRYTKYIHEEAVFRIGQLRLTDIYGKELTSETAPTLRLLRGEILTGEQTMNICVHTFADEELWLNIAGAPLYEEGDQISGAVLVIRDYTAHHETERRTSTALHALLQFAEALVQSGETWEKPEEAMAEQGADQVAQRLAALIGNVLGYRRVWITASGSGIEPSLTAAAYGLTPDEERAWHERRPGAILHELLAGTPEASYLQAGQTVVIDLSQRAFQSGAAIYGACKCLLVPMQLKDRQMGMITLISSQETYEYPDEERSLARALAQLAALTLERAQLFQERMQERAMVLALREANRLMDEFIGIAGHELRTPLTTIKGSVQLAQRQLARVLQQKQTLPAEISLTLTAIQNHLARSERQISMQNRLISDLLDVARIHEDRLELLPETCNLEELVRACIEDQHYLTPDRTILLRSEVQGEAVLVLADVDRVRQVINNYLSNALKYSSADQVVEICLDLSENGVRVSVRDRGPGLLLEEQQRVWERFYRVPTIEVQSGSGIGLGLGLHISRRIIEGLGGQVGLQSVPGQGATFWFTLPGKNVRDSIEA